MHNLSSTGARGMGRVGDVGLGGGRPGGGAADGVRPAGGVSDVGLGGGRAGLGAGGVGRPGVGTGGIGRPGVGVGGVGRPGVGVGGFGGPVSPASRYATGAAVRGNFNNFNLYGAGWYGAHPGAWYPAAWAAATPWTAATWASAGAYCGCDEPAPTYYDYGNNVTYQDNSVYVNGQDAGSSQEFYDQASSLASSGAQAQASTDDNWLPLGVFALTKGDQKQSDVTIQLAVNKQGIIRGNYTDTAADKTQVVQGSVDKSTQRVAFTVGDDKTNVIETGLYNLTKDEAPALIHAGQDKSEQVLLVRLKKPAASAE